MSPVNYRGRRRLGADEPVERLRGLLADDERSRTDPETGEIRAVGPDSEISESAAPLPAEEAASSWRTPVRWRIPWAAVALAVLAVAAVLITVLWPGDSPGEPADAVTAELGTPAAKDGGQDPVAVTAPDAEGRSGTEAGDGSSQDPASVHVVGEVHRPGVVEVPAGARVQDAVDAAGGLTESAVVDQVNLAAPAADGSQVFIPDAAAAESLPVPVPPGGAASGGQAQPGAPGTEGTAEGQGASQGLVNLNTATVTELETLPKVGPVLAQRIVDHRDQVGGFRSVAELDDVSGIGPAMMSALTPLVTV